MLNLNISKIHHRSPFLIRIFCCSDRPKVDDSPCLIASLSYNQFYNTITSRVRSDWPNSIQVNSPVSPKWCKNIPSIFCGNLSDSLRLLPDLCIWNHWSLRRHQRIIFPGNIWAFRNAGTMVKLVIIIIKWLSEVYFSCKILKGCFGIRLETGFMNNRWCNFLCIQSFRTTTQN